MSGRHDDSAKMAKLKELLHRRENRICADCSSPDPKWASANIGVFICLKCSGVHRSLGTHISKVLSVTLDQWSDNEIDNMIEVGGNSHANAIYEAFLPQNYSKPHPDSTQEEREKFIRSKYELQEFLEPSLRIVSHQSSDSGKHADSASHSVRSKSEVGSTVLKLQIALCSTLVSMFCNSRFNFTNPRFDLQVGMVEFIGILNVKVKGGTNLAIRDMSSSDPYVVLTLGQQKAQTKVIKANLNPVWNEELKLSVPQQYGPLKLQVFDHDMLSNDDLMGEAEIDLQPMINAAGAFGDPEMLGDMQIGRWLKSGDNALVRDSAVVVAGGEVKQELALKLQFTESGEVELEMHWIPLNM
uniref:ZAC n=1 Tax=Oryza punctata TaxID=4537 RepID=A0A0E0JWX4_ORYPU